METATHHALVDIVGYHGTTDVLEWIANYLGKHSEDYKPIMKIVERNRKEFTNRPSLAAYLTNQIV